LRQERDQKDIELQKSEAKAHEAINLATEEASKLKTAKEVIKSLTAQVIFIVESSEMLYQSWSWCWHHQLFSFVIRSKKKKSSVLLSHTMTARGTAAENHAVVACLCDTFGFCTFPNLH